VKLNLYDRILLTLSVFFLGVLTLRPTFEPNVAHAQSGNAQYYIEPGTTMLVSPDKSKQVVGKVVVDLTNGSIWGFPTLQELPYPIDSIKSQPPTSYPIYLGKFDFSAMHHSQ
jgi:hypothetical protein